MEITILEENYNHYLASYQECLTLWIVPYTSQYIPTSYGDTHILISGSMDKPPLILLHGLGFSSTMWYPNVEELSKHYCIYAVDIIGDANKSISSHNPRSRLELSQWLLEVITELKLHKPHILGLSYGGFISLNFAIHYPEHVNKVVLMSPAATLKPFRIQFFVRIFTTLLVSKKGMLFHSFLEWMFAERVKLHPLFLQQLSSGMKYRRSLSANQDKKSSKSQWPVKIPSRELNNISNDVLLLLGDKEVIYNPVQAMKRAQKWIPSIDAYLLSNVGHGMSMEQPEMINEYILNFLRVD